MILTHGSVPPRLAASLKSDERCPFVARLRHADGPLKGLLMGEDRRSSAHGQNDANGTKQTC